MAIVYRLVSQAVLEAGCGCERSTYRNYVLPFTSQFPLQLGEGYIQDGSQWTASRVKCADSKPGPLRTRVFSPILSFPDPWKPYGPEAVCRTWEGHANSVVLSPWIWRLLSQLLISSGNSA